MNQQKLIKNLFKWKYNVDTGGITPIKDLNLKNRSHSEGKDYQGVNSFFFSKRKYNWFRFKKSI